MLDIVFGQTTNLSIARMLVAKLQNIDFEGTFYIGYPVLSSADEKIEVDALLVSKETGPVAFLLASEFPTIDDEKAWTALSDQQNKLYFALTSSLSRHQELREKRELAVQVNVATVFPAKPKVPDDIEGLFISIDELTDSLNQIHGPDEKYYKPLQAALQKVSNIKPAKKRTKVSQPASKGATLRKLEKEIANLDQWQKRAAIESPEGPQRIRGLAGSGKTIVLALKAAYLHAQHPDWKIAITFQTRSLYQQLNDLIRRFCFEHLNDEPNWENLRVLHAWGGSEGPGMYTEIARYCEAPFQNFLTASNRFGRDDAFKGACSELLSIVHDEYFPPMFDAVLIDEAQDLPPAFFQLLYKFTSEPKRIIWAYDELQRLSEASMPTTSEIFGTKGDGSPLVKLTNDFGKPRQDIILPVCYRNTPWALTLAHALGFGIYRHQLVQHFDEPSLWREIGYRVDSGTLADGQMVTLERDPESYPEFFRELVHKHDAVQTKVFETETEQAAWVAKEIKKNLTEDELEYDDILIVVPNAYKAKSKSALVTEQLAALGIGSHLAGVTTSKDELFNRRSIAMANIYRSKGNEAPMIYVIDCQHCYAGHELITLRNTLFTAITRSRAWVRLSGFGEDMNLLAKEIEAVKAADYKLKFKVPTERERKMLRQIHRDRTADEKANLKKAEDGLKHFLEALQEGDFVLENLPPELRTGIAQLLQNQASEDDECD